ncbi:hypothetical protein LXL04_013714 [Taraxacum kok-saghyz]
MMPLDLKIGQSADIKTSARGLLGADLNQCLPTSSRLFSHIGASHIFSLITASLQLSPPPSFIAHRLLPPLTAIVASAATSLCGRLCCFPSPLIAAPEPDVKKQTVFFLQTADVWSTSSSAEGCNLIFVVDVYVGFVLAVTQDCKFASKKENL